MNVLLKVAVTDMRYFARSKFPKKLSLPEKFWLDMTSSLEIRKLILSREVGYFV